MLDFFRPVPKKRKVKINGKKGIIFANLSAGKRIIFYMGNVVLLAMIVGIIYLYYPLSKALISYEFNKNTNTKTEEIKPKIEELKSQDMWIEIPKIGAMSKVITGVSPFVRDEYKKVIDENLVAQAKDTSLPGSGIGTMSYLFAHSTQSGIAMLRKNSIFYLLGQLQQNDKVFIKNGDQQLEYSVYKQIVVSPKEIEYLKYKETDKELLLLQTCWPIGTDWKRLIVFAQRIK